MIGSKLKIARSASGLSLRALANAMGSIVSAQAIGKYERDEDMPSSRILIALAATLNVTEDYLLCEDELALEGVDFRKKAGASAREEATLQARVIVIKRSTWSERKRFNLAHELGHMVIAPSGDIDEEKAAHRFAGAFLMPADALRAEIGAIRSSISIGELIALKKRFGVSIQALTYRCKDLGIINQAAFARLFKVFTERGWRTEPFEEPESMQPDLEEPKRFERLCFRALAERVISEARAAELLGISVRELDARLDHKVAA